MCDPVYSTKDMKKDIAHYCMDVMARHFLKTYDDAFVYYILPPDDGFFILDRRLERDFPGRVKYYTGVHNNHNRTIQFINRPEWFGDLVHNLGYAWDWDILLTMRGPGLSQVRRYNFKKHHAPKQIVLHDHFPFFAFKKGAAYFYNHFKELELDTLASYMCCDFIGLQSQYEKRHILQTARKILSPSWVRKLEKKMECSFVLSEGLDLDYPLRRDPPEPRKKVVGIFTQRIGKAGRHPEDILRSFLYPFATTSRDKVEFQLTTNSASDLSVELKNKYKFVTYYRSSREEFWERLRNCNFCISFSTTEGMPASILEAICWGVIPILIRDEWSEDMAGKDYPFLFDNFTQAVAHIRRMINEPVECFKIYREWYRTYFKPYLDRHATLQKMLDKAVERHRSLLCDCDKGRSSDIVDLMVGYIKEKKYKRVKFTDLQHAMFKDKLLRKDADYYGLEERSPHRDMGDLIPARFPVYYRIIHEIIHREDGWKEGLKVGEIVTNL